MADRIEVPRAIRREADALVISWAEAGHQGRFAAYTLRLACPCAACVDELTNRPLLDPASVPRDIAPLELELVGAYGIKIRWSDGHGTGIYTFRMLRERCPCDRCAG